MSTMTSNLPRTEAQSRWRVFDALLVWIIATVGAVAALGLALAPKFILPAEDAVILFQYSRNLAQTGAITFIPGGVHAEGATDFAWMVFIALGMKLGIDAFWLIALVNVVSMALLGVLLVRIAGCKVTPLPLLFVSGAMALMPQIAGAALGFSVLPFAVLLVLMTWFFLQRNDVAVPITAIILCLFRPDGIVFAVPLMLAALILYPNRGRRFMLQAALFILPGILYFLWRWHYFGQLLPLTFLVKADNPRMARALGLFIYSSLHEGKLLSFFAIAILVFVLRGRFRDKKNQAVLLCLVVLPNLFYMAMRLDQNVGHRFYIYLPVGIAVLIAMNWQSLRPESGALLRFGVLCWLIFPMAVWIDDTTQVWPHMFDNRTALAKDLAQFKSGTMIVSEAGVLPYYSRWTAYDAWGLNTDRFAHHLFQPSDVESVHPDLLLVLPSPVKGEGNAACTPRPDWETPYQGRTWPALTRNVITGASTDNYDAWILPYGNSAYRAHYHLSTYLGRHECWFVRKDSPLRAGIEDVLAKHEGQTREQFRANNPPPITSWPEPKRLKPILQRGPLGIPKAIVGKVWHFLYD
jgi:hypothetical protein